MQQEVDFWMLKSPQQLIMPEELRDEGFEGGFVMYGMVVGPENEIVNSCVIGLNLSGKSGERLLWYTGFCEPAATPEYPSNVTKYIPWLMSSLSEVEFRVENREDENVNVSFKLGIK